MALPYLRKPDGVVVDFQNGINDERVAAVAGRERTLGCVITISAGMYEPGHAIRTDRGAIGFKIGEHDGKDTPSAPSDSRAIMSDVAPTKVTTNLWGERWSKLAVNCMVNPISPASPASTPPRCGPSHGVAAHRRPPGGRGDPGRPRARPRGRAHLRHRRPALRRRRGGQGPRGGRGDMAREAKEPGGGRPSLLQDVMKGRRTEINYLNGYVSEQGRQVGVTTPFNDKIVELVTRVPPGMLKPDPKNLEPLVAMLPN